MAKFEVEILNAKGTCDKEQIKAMAQCGDLLSESIKNHINDVVSINGYIKIHVTTDNDSFDNVLYSTDKGFIYSGSEVLRESVDKYMDKFEKLQFKEIKTKKGTTYKVAPILSTEEVA